MEPQGAVSDYIYKKFIDKSPNDNPPGLCEIFETISDNTSYRETQKRLNRAKHQSLSKFTLGLSMSSVSTQNSTFSLMNDIGDIILFYG